MKTTNKIPCHLFRSPNTKQRTPSGVLFALAGALVVCRGGVSPPVYNGWIFGRGDPSPTEDAARANFRRRRISLRRKRREHICKQTRRPTNADSRGRLSLLILCAFPRRNFPQAPCNLPDFMLYRRQHKKTLMPVHIKVFI